MPRITYSNEQVVEAAAATSILDVSLQSGIPHTHACGGNARCSTCRVLVIEGKTGEYGVHEVLGRA